MAANDQKNPAEGTMKHTHFHVKLQSGAFIWAATKPEKRSNDASGAARGDISCFLSDEWWDWWEKGHGARKASLLIE
jgi:hypothetical protein